MTDPTFTNNNDDPRDIQFVGFAGAPVAPPPSWVLDPFSDELNEERQAMLDYAREDYYVHVGVDHAAEIVDQLIAQRRGVAHEGIDLDTAVAQFSLTDAEGHNDYIYGLLRWLADEADAVESAATSIDEGIGDNGHQDAADFFARIAGLHEAEVHALFREVPNAVVGEEASVAELYRRAGGLSQQDVRAVVDQIDQLTRALATQVGMPLPIRLQAAARQQRLRADAAALAFAIDELSVVRALPGVVVEYPDEAVIQRERLAARIGAAYAGQREVLHHLTADRAAIVEDLLPSIADQPPRTAPANAEGDSRELTELRAHVDTLLTALTGDSDADVTQLAMQIAAQDQRDPTLSRHLPPTQAGLVNYLAGLFFDDAAQQLSPPDTDPTRRATSSATHPPTA